MGPSIGITGTPVIDGASSAPRLFVVAATLNPPPPGSPLNTLPDYPERLYALDLATGTITQPVQSFDFYVSHFDSSVQLQRSALLLDNQSVYAAFGSNGAPGDYHGWLFKFDVSLQGPPESFVVTPVYGGTDGGGIWQSGGGPSVDFNHNVFVATGDGIFDVERGGCDQGAGQDVGASALVILPDSTGSSSLSPLLVGGSKGGSLYVVNRDSMGQFSCPDLASVVQINQPILNTPLYWNGVIYVAPGSGNLVSYALNQGLISLTPSASRSRETFGPQGATPVISANGTDNAVLWLIDTRGALATPNRPATLRAYDPSDLSNELYDSGIDPHDQAGLAVKFTVPTVANGKVYVGTQSELDVYGLCSEARVTLASCGN